MPEQIVRLSANAPLPEIEFKLGFAHRGKYAYILWDEDGANPTGIENGVTTDTVPDKYPFQDLIDTGVIAGIRDLDKRVFSWEVLIASHDTTTPNQEFHVEVHMTQGGQHVAGSPFIDHGKLNSGMAYRIHLMRFIVS